MIIDKHELFVKALKPLCKETGDNPEILATKVTNLFKKVPLTPFTALTAVTQLQSAIKRTSGGIMSIIKNVHKSDIEEFKDSIKTVYKLSIENDEVTYTNFSDIAKLCNLASSNPELTKGCPIGIVKSKLHNAEDGTDEEVYLVMLCGTGFIEGQANGIISDILSGMELDSVYLESVLKAITDYVPMHSKLILAGFSLGGMMAQQVMVQPVIYENYDVHYVLAGAAPALCVDERDDKFTNAVEVSRINRVISYYDLVPYLCIDYFLRKPYLNYQIPLTGTVYETLHVEYDKNYNTGFIGQHCIGYMKDTVWKSYDAVGIKDGKHEITFKFSEIAFYPSKAIINGKISTIE